MIELTGIGMGMMMTALAVGVAGLMLEATLSILSQSLRMVPVDSKTATKP